MNKLLKILSVSAGTAIAAYLAGTVLLRSKPDHSRNSGLGLKDFRFRLPFWRIKINLEELSDALKYALQRAWRGLDDLAYWDLDSHLDAEIVEVLTWLRHHRHGSPAFGDTHALRDENAENADDCHTRWDAILDKILYHFRETDEDTCSQQNEYDADYDKWQDEEFGKDRNFDKWLAHLNSHDKTEIEELYFERSRELDAYREKHHKRAWHLVAKYIRFFWD